MACFVGGLRCVPWWLPQFRVWCAVRVRGIRHLSSLFSLFTTFSDIGLGSDSVCARPSSHRIKSFDSLGSQPSHSRTSKLFQGQYRSLVSLRELVIEIGMCWGNECVCRRIRNNAHASVKSCRARGGLTLPVLFLYSDLAFAYHQIYWIVCLMTAFGKLVYFGGYILRFINLYLQRCVL